MYERTFGRKIEEAQAEKLKEEQEEYNSSLGKVASDFKQISKVENVSVFKELEKNETPFPDAYYRKISFRSSQIERGITRIVDSNYETNYPKHMSVRYVRDAVD